MKFYEYQAKKLLSNYGINTPSGIICNNLEELKKARKKICSTKWILKCQIHAGGRGKAGGIKVINKDEEIETFANKWFGKNLITNQTDNIGKIVKKILIEDADIKILNEFYLSFLIDFKTRNLLAITSKKGGIKIEENARKNPNLIHKITIDPLLGPQNYQARILAYQLNLNDIQIKKFTDIFIKLAKMFLKLNLLLIEINPLIINKNNDFICLDSKMVMDKNAAFKNKKMVELYDSSQNNTEEQAAKLGLNYIPLDGNIGCIVNGAGLAMCTMDMIKLYGGKASNFLDIGGGIKKENIIHAFKIILSHNSVKAILINIFGGIVRCDYIAEGIINAINLINIKLPIIVRLEGNNANLGFQKLSNNNDNVNIIPAYDLNNAIKLVINAVKR